MPKLNVGNVKFHEDSARLWHLQFTILWMQSSILPPGDSSDWHIEIGLDYSLQKVQRGTVTEVKPCLDANHWLTRVQSTHLLLLPFRKRKPL